MEKPKPNIRSFNKEEIVDFITEMGEPKFRGKQIYEWLWKKGVISFDEMSNIPIPLREKLEAKFRIGAINVDDAQHSEDGTVKCAFKLHDGNVVEGVLIPTPDRMTACISSQVGCSLSCSFCATGKLKRMRNIDADEIYDQVKAIAKLAEEKFDQPLSNIVLMGMGEPLLNYKQVMRAMDMVSSEDGMGMSPKRVTLSTAGIAKMIRKMGDDGTKINLALSLHAANDEKRDKIMPINEQNNLAELKAALKYYHGKTGQRMTLEYVMLKDFNDSLKDAVELVQFCEHLPVKVNLIEYNPTDDGEFQPSASHITDDFADRLKQEGVPVSVRRSRGKDIDAACGQLANKNEAVQI